MKTIKIKHSNEIPNNYTGIVKLENGDSFWYKNKRFHREDGPAFIGTNKIKEWWLAGEYIWDFSRSKIDLRNCIILSKESHPIYSTVKVWKWIDKNEIKEQVVIPGMEEYIVE